ncbi:MAG: SPOR domain-containing protein [Gemmatimonadales bacterium]|nr:SPOR domain-containing protein [Gemmatimonadales bacterium]
MISLALGANRAPLMVKSHSWLALFGGLILFASPSSAQDVALPTTPELLAIVRLAQDGYADSARAAVDDLLGRTVPADPLYAEALYTAATVAKNGEDARLLFSRVVVEHGSSPWADRSLLRLTQLDYGTGDTEAAMLRVRRLMTDYPTSPTIPAASLWGARAAFERRDNQQACAWLERGINTAGADVEMKNQLEFTYQRCTNPVPARTSTGAERVVPPSRDIGTPAAPRPSAAQPSQKKAVGPWRVQVAAVRDPAAIRRVEQQIARAGLTAYKVPGPNGLTKLQAGPFATREAAVERVAELKAMVGGSPFVVRVE